MCIIKLIVGLGNPGERYQKTRHNTGACCVNLLADRQNQQLKVEKKFFGDTGLLNLAGHNIWILVPSTFMNLSGKAVIAITNFYHIEPNRILVVHDDLNLPPGVVKMKLGGSNGGHNGLKDIQNKFGHNPNFYRLRIGIGRPDKKSDVANFVLGNPTDSEHEIIYKAISESTYAIEILVKEGFEDAVHYLHSCMG